MDRYIREAKRVVNELGSKVAEAQKFQYDTDFLKCLAEEIKASIGCLETPKAMFEIYENGEISFVSLVNEVVTSANLIGISLGDFKKGLSVDEKKQQISEQAGIAKECLELELMNRKKELIDRLLEGKK